jgi:hypothetical protein
MVDADPTQTVLGDTVNVDVGALITLIVCVVVEEQAPFVTVKLTVFVPELDQDTA